MTAEVVSNAEATTPQADPPGPEEGSEGGPKGSLRLRDAGEDKEEEKRPETFEERKARLAKIGRDPKGKWLPGKCPTEKNFSSGRWVSDRNKKTAITRQMQAMTDHTADELWRIMTDPKEKASRRMAAIRLYSACNDNDKRSDKNFDRILDRIEGKPAQTTRLEVEAVKTPEQLLSEIHNDSDYLKEPEALEYKDETDSGAGSVPADPESGGDGDRVA